jgi:nucleoside-diphosphate-sugar epimerase
MKTKVLSLDELLDRDLDFVCGNLKQEFGRIAGKNLLITGGAGFLGYYLVLSALHWNKTAAAASKIRVTVYDNFVRGTPAWLGELQGNSHLTVQRQDMIQPLPANMGDFQYIVHAAGIASPMYYRKYPLQTIDANINGLRNLLDYSVRQAERGKPVEGFLFYSSSEIYGDPTPDNIPTPETYRGNVSCTGPRACYDESKRFGETLCVNFARQHNVPVRVARPFNNYGPGLKITDGRVIPDFARNILSGSDIVMLSDGLAKRTYCYTADAVSGYFKVLVRGRNGEAYNIGVEHPEISVIELADKAVKLGKDLFGYRGKVVRSVSSDKDYLVDNPNRRCPVIAKARTELGYDPKVIVDEGLRRSLLWYSGNREASEA